MIRHKWDISPAKAMELQRGLAGKVSDKPLNSEPREIAGVDCAFVRGGAEVLAGVVVLEAGSMKLIRSELATRPCKMPYIPGMLSFREAPAVIAAVSKLGCRPDLLMCDGQGVAHPRGVGLASHVGLWLDMPTIGVAKSRLCGSHTKPGLARGCRRRLCLDGRVVGTVLRTRTSVKPLYVSIGHKVSLDDAVRWTLRCGRGYRLPEPTRLAHQLVTRAKDAPRNWNC